MGKVTLLKEKHIEILYDEEKHIMYDHWIGFQTVENVMDGCEKILKLFKERPQCNNVLNDNSEVTGPWQGATEWVSSVWFPKMMDEGLKNFAWVLSSNIFAELSAKNVSSDGDIIQYFNDYKQAEKFLQAKEVV
ncbi:hypothetical protein FNH22_29555 [Fulvivirga sp. M361]|uniref:hypothetical protein n=1 Tax=Fulvivirga sp. M361 TaxID=2594266 RepID=UPI00117B7091|nr:hypothetical protein [Fulvivirga sp. M361]TRX48202.1 hypothetical protein FNH22_29555 [Fulvivirga sp. M361]